MTIDRVDILIAGAGPAGLRAAQVLAAAGRDVLVAERNPVVGPKTCAGGLTTKAVRELEAADVADALGRDHRPTVSFRGEAPHDVDDPAAIVRTVARARLGAAQAAAARRAGAAILTGTDVREFDLAARRARVGDRVVQYEHLIGADGSASRVRRALGLPVARAYFACEYNVPRPMGHPLLIAFDSRRLASGYFWIFPHRDYTSIGAGAPVALVPPADVRRALEAFAARLGLEQLPRFEGATIEVDFVGFHFRDGVHLVGDAAGVASAATGEGIYAALVTGEEIASQILDPRAPAPKTRAWLRVKRAHQVVARAWRSTPLRQTSLRLLETAMDARWTRRRVASFFLGG